MKPTILKSEAVRGALWTVAGYGSVQTLRLASSLILTRLLTPQYFGLMALAQSVLVGLHLFSDFGFNTSIVRHQSEADDRFLNTIWTMQILRGLYLFLACAALAPVASRFYGDPRLAWILPALGTTALIAGFNSTSLAILSREMAVRQTVTLEVGAQACAAAVMIGWAAIRPGIGPLIAGGIAASIFQLVCSHSLVRRHRDRLAWDPVARRTVVSFGKWILLSSAMTFLANQSDRLIIGRIFPIAFLGVYGIAFMLADIPRAIMLALSNKIIFPSFARLAHLPRSEFRARIQPARAKVLLLAAGCVAALVCAGDFAVALLYDARYAAAGWMTPLLALGIWPVVLTQTIDPALFAIGKPRVVAVGSFLSFVTVGVGILVGKSLLGEFGAVLAVSMSNVPPYIATAFGLQREKLACFRQDCWSTCLFLLLIGLFSAARWGIGLHLPPTLEYPLFR